jgi:hypothetical protein
VKEGFPTIAMQDEQDMLAFGVFRVLVETDVAPELCPESEDGLRSAVPFEIEAEGAPMHEVKAFTVGGGDRSAILLGPNPPAAATALFADPEQKSLIDSEPAGYGEVDEEAVGFQVVSDVPAVVARVLRPADIGPWRVAAVPSQQPPPARCQKEERGPAREAGRIDHLPAIDETVIGEEAQTHLGGADAVEEELLDLEGVEVPVVVESLEDSDIALGEGSQEAGGLFLG